MGKGGRGSEGGREIGKRKGGPSSSSAMSLALYVFPKGLYSSES